MTTKHRIRVLLADDHTLVAEGMARLIETEFDLVATAENGRAALEAVIKFSPDIALLDISMPVLNGFDAARQILAAKPQTKIVFMTMHADLTYVREALRAGASGYLLKRSASSEIGTAIRAAMRGQIYITPLIAGAPELARSAGEPNFQKAGNDLTPRQREVLQLVAEGHSAKQVANHLNISVKTVEFHKQMLMRKLGVHTAVELTKYAIQHGFAASE